ncbi:MAG: hydrogenase maturation protease [Thiohalorhabdus sp.]|uniref:hydrogenase maturation protease n=1 Tax=Thiohalorhabdus sp. TaxID=3094134 RepID=UPI003980C6DF
MIPVAVLGIGSPFGGDRVGWTVVEALRAEAEASWPAVRLAALDRPGPGLLPHLEGVGHAVLVDAVRSGAPPGTLHRFRHLDELPAAEPLSSHGFGLAEALALAGRVGVLSEWVVVGVEADARTPPAEAVVARAAQAVREEVAARMSP